MITVFRRMMGVDRIDRKDLFVRDKSEKENMERN